MQEIGERRVQTVLGYYCKLALWAEISTRSLGRAMLSPVHVSPFSQRPTAIRAAGRLMILIRLPWLGQSGRAAAGCARAPAALRC